MLSPLLLHKASAYAVDKIMKSDGWMVGVERSELSVGFVHLSHCEGKKKTSANQKYYMLSNHRSSSESITRTVDMYIGAKPDLTDAWCIFIYLFVIYFLFTVQSRACAAFITAHQWLICCEQWLHYSNPCSSPCTYFPMFLFSCFLQYSDRTLIRSRSTTPTCFCVEHKVGIFPIRAAYGWESANQRCIKLGSFM